MDRSTTNCGDSKRESFLKRIGVLEMDEAKNKTIPVLKSEVITLRPVEERDIEIIRMWRQQDWARRQFIYQEEITHEQQMKWYKKYLRNANDYMWIVEVAGKSIGTIALYNINLEMRTAEFGRLLIGDKSFHGRNMAVEFGRLIIAYAREELKLDVLVLDVWQDNVAALKTYEKLGFVKGSCTMIGSRILQKMEIIIEDSIIG